MSIYVCVCVCVSVVSFGISDILDILSHACSLSLPLISFETASHYAALAVLEWPQTRYNRLAPAS